MAGGTVRTAKFIKAMPSMKRLSRERTQPAESVNSRPVSGVRGSLAHPLGTISLSAPPPSVPRTNSPMEPPPSLLLPTSVAAAPSPKSGRTERSAGLMNFV